MRIGSDKKEVEYCECGFPQSRPIPHEHSRKAAIISEFVKLAGELDEKRLEFYLKMLEKERGVKL